MRMMNSPRIQTDLISIAKALNLYRLGNSLIGIFVPLIILKSGGALWMIALFYLLYALVKLCINYPCMKIIQNKGATTGLTAGFMFGALQIIFILSYAHYHLPLFLVSAACFMACTNAFTWNAQHYFISSIMDKQTKSSTIAAIEMYGQFLEILGPLAGGFIGAVFGATWLIAAAILCMLLATIPMRKMTHLQIINTSAGIGYNLRGAPLRDLVANYCFNIETSVGVMVWPMYLAVMLASYRAIGGIVAVAAAASIATTWLAGYQGDKGRDRAVLRQGVAISSVIDLLRIFAMSPFLITLTGAAYKSSLAYFQNSWTSTYYDHAQNKGPQYIMSMEIACDLAYVSLWGVLLFLSLMFNNKHIFFNAAFVIAASVSWGCLLITRQGSRKTMNAKQ